jgi:propionate CoA-transferase
MKKQIILAGQAAELISSGETVIIGGSGGIGVAESILEAIESRFISEGAPKNLTIIHTTGVGAVTQYGLNRFAHDGLIKRVIGGNFGLQLPFMKELIVGNRIEAYNFPQGVMCQLYRAMAARQPGLLSHVGLDTYIDPRIEGGKMNEATIEDLVELIEIGGREMLFFHAPDPDVAILRGTTADDHGNITLEHEPATLEGLSIAQAVHNAGGMVICQVKRMTQRGQLNPHMVRIPGFLIDKLVIDETQSQNYAVNFDPSLCGEKRRSIESIRPDPLSERRIIARRAALELYPGAIVNMGVGISAGIPNVTAEEGLDGMFSITVESGVIGGVAGHGLYFGSAYNPEAIIDQAYMFDFYDGGGLDIAFVSFAEVDVDGNVNVTRFGNRNDGAGGFIDITQNARKIVFSGTFTGGGLKIDLDKGSLRIEREGRIRKFVSRVNQISFSGQRALESGIDMMFLTERAVFRMTDQGMEISEVAPGIVIENDILPYVPFPIGVSQSVRSMDRRIFFDTPMGIRDEILTRTK